MVTDEGIHDGILKSVAHVESASYIGRRDDDAIGVAVSLRGEIAALFPSLIPLIFQLFWLVGLVHTDVKLLCLKKAQVYMIRREFAGFSSIPYKKSLRPQYRDLSYSLYLITACSLERSSIQGVYVEDVLQAMTTWFVKTSAGNLRLRA